MWITELISSVVVVPITWMLLGFLFLKMKAGAPWAYFAYTGWSLLVLGYGISHGSYGGIAALLGIALGTAIGVWLLQAMALVPPAKAREQEKPLS